jgi:hypothetical protein
MNASDSCRDHNDIYAQYSEPIQNIHRSTAMTTRHRISKNLPFLFPSFRIHVLQQRYLYADGAGKILVWLLKTREEGNIPARNMKLT